MMPRKSLGVLESRAAVTSGYFTRPCVAAEPDGAAEGDQAGWDRSTR